MNTNRIDAVFFNANHLEWTANFEKIMPPFSEDMDTELDGASFMEKNLMDQEIMKEMAIFLQIKAAKIRMRAKERAPGRSKLQKWNLSRQATLQVAYLDATTNKISDKISIATRLAFKLMDLEPGDDDHVKLTRSSPAWAERLKVEAKKVKGTLNKMEIEQQRSANQKLAGIKQNVFDTGIHGVRRVTRPKGANVKMQQVNQECPIGLKWKWRADQTGDQIESDKTKLEDWIRTGPTNFKCTTSISDAGLEIQVALLSDMQAMVKWALSNTTTSLYPTPTLIVSKGPWKGESMVTATEYVF